MKQPTEQQKALLLVAIVALLAVVLAYQFVWRPMTEKRGTVGPQVARLRADLENLKRQLSHVAEVEQATAQRRAAVAQLEARLSRGVAIDTLLADLSSMAKEAHVRIESLEPLDVKGAAPGSEGVYAEIPIQIHAKGGYHQLGTFLSALEQSPRLMRVVRLELTGNDDEPWRQSAHVIVSTFRLLGPAEATP